MKQVTLQPVNTAGAMPLSKTNGSQEAGQGFREIFDKSVAAVNGQLQEADRLAQGLASGQHANIHETMIAMEKASISFRLMTRVQQKAIDAYHEIMRLQL